LRTAADRKALLKGLKDGTIDAIVSQHTPHEIEYKEVEYHSAAEGIVGLQTVLPLAIQAGLSVEQLVDKLAIGPRRVLGLPVPELKEGAAANLVLFDIDKEWRFNQQTNRSKSANSPLFGHRLKGAVTMVINKRQTANTQL